MLDFYRSPARTSRRPSLRIIAFATAVFANPPGIAAVANGETSSAVAKALARFSADPGYAHATVGFALLDIDSEQLLSGLDPDRSLTPASVMKAITTACFLRTMAPHERFRTEVVANGPVGPDGMLHGDLVVRGGGDPTLGSDRVPGSPAAGPLLDQWTRAVTAAGIRRVAGCLVADDSFFPPDPVPGSFDWNDIGNGYGAGTSGLSFHDNMYFLALSTEGAPGSAARVLSVDPPLVSMRFVNRLRVGPSGSGDRADIFGAPGSNDRLLAGTVAGKDGATSIAIKGALPDPAAALAELFAARLEAAGVTFAGQPRATAGATVPAAAGATTVIAHESPPVGAILKILNKQSFNMYAETLLMHTARSGSDADDITTGDRDAGLAAHRRFLGGLGVTTSGFILRDGSGLSRSNAVTARGMAQFFGAMRHEPHYAMWRDTLPNLGVDGDLRGRETTGPLRGMVQAKTGLLNGPPVRSLCGYVTVKSGRILCFALLSNFHTKDWRAVDADFDALLGVIHENY